jgi:predicted Zn-dependent protease/TolB-like protein
VCLALLLGRGAAGAPAPQPVERLLVVPFENVQRDGHFTWVSEAAATLLADDLDALGIKTISREERLKACERLQLPPFAVLSEATLIRLGQVMGAAQVVIGSFETQEGQITVKARAIRLDSGRMRAPAVETGRLSDLFGVFERLARQLLPPGLAGPDHLEVEHGSLPVFETYVKGLMAETPAAQIRALDTAVKLSPDFAPARIALWQVYTAQGDHARAAAAALAVPATSRLYRRARFLAALSRIHLKQYDQAYQQLKALLDASPTPALYNNLGVIQARRGATPQTGRATYFFTKAAESDPQDSDYAFNLGYAYWFERDLQTAVFWLNEAVRRHPADGEAHFVLAAALHARGATIEAERERDLARQLSSAYADWERRPNAASEPVPRGLERLRDDLDAPRLGLVDTALAPTEQRDQADLAAFHAGRGRRLFEQRQDAEAIDELKRSLYVSPYQADVHLLLGRIYLQTGRRTEAIEALTISLWSAESAAAHAVLGEAYIAARDLPRARAELRKAQQLDPNDADARRLAADLAVRQQEKRHGAL